MASMVQFVLLANLLATTAYLTQATRTQHAPIAYQHIITWAAILVGPALLNALRVQLPQPVMSAYLLITWPLI